jgi:hypothetical protein
MIMELEPMPTRYVTKADAIGQNILAALGEDADDFTPEMLDKIFDQAFEWRIDRWDGVELLNTGGFECIVPVEVFWAIVWDVRTR